MECLMRYSATVLQFVFEVSTLNVQSTKSLILKFLTNKNPINYHSRS